MIKTSNYRNNGGGEVLLSESEQKIEDAADQLLRFELAYGGKISACSAESLEIKTRVLDCFDRTVFSGTKEEMEPLFVAAALYLEAEKKVDINDLVKKLGDMTGGRPLLVALAAPLLKGQETFEHLKTMLIKW